MPVASWQPEKYKRFLNRLREARLEADLTQVDVAAVLNLPQQHISRVELGERRIDPVELVDLATLYGKPLSFFLD